MKRDSRGPGRGVAAGVEGDATIKASEATELRLPASIVAGEFMHENDGPACAGFFVEEVDAVRCGRVWHIRDYNGYGWMAGERVLTYHELGPRGDHGGREVRPLSMMNEIATRPRRGVASR